MKKKIIAILKYAIFLAIGIGLVWWQISKMTISEKEQFIISLQHAKYIYIIPVVIMGLLSHFFRALRWKLLIDPIGKVSVSNAFYATLSGYLGNTFVPRAGEILRCTMLSRYEKVSFSKLLGTVIVERVFDLVTFFIFIFLTIIIQVETVRSFMSSVWQNIFDANTGWPVWLKLLIAVVALFVLYLFVNWFLKRYANNRIVARFRDLWNNLKEGLSTILHLKKRSAFLVYTFLIWAMYLMQIYVGFNTLAITSGLGLPAAMSVLTLSTVAMIITPGGLGAFPVAVQQVLLIYHINNLSFGWLVWGVNTAIIILAGLASFGLLIYQNKDKHEKDRRDKRKDIPAAGA